MRINNTADLKEPPPCEYTISTYAQTRAAAISCHVAPVVAKLGTKPPYCTELGVKVGDVGEKSDKLADASELKAEGDKKIRLPLCDYALQFKQDLSVGLQDLSVVKDDDPIQGCTTKTQETAEGFDKNSSRAENRRPPRLHEQASCGSAGVAMETTKAKCDDFSFKNDCNNFESGSASRVSSISTSTSRGNSVTSGTSMVSSISSAEESPRSSFGSILSNNSIGSLVSSSSVPPVVVLDNGIVTRSCITSSSTACITNIRLCESSTECNSDLTWLHQFNTTLDMFKSHPQIKVIKNASQMNSLLDFYYVTRFSKTNVDYDVRMFPYLHGLQSESQRDFFGRSPEDISPNIPMMNLMFVRAQKGDCPSLRNTVELEDLLVRKGKAYISFNEYVASLSHKDLNNRNYRDQIRLMAPYSSFVVYNYNNDLKLNSQLAILLNSLKSPGQFVYVVNADWKSVSSAYFESTPSDAAFTLNPLEEKVHSNAEIECSINEGRDGLYNCEQALIWRLNSKRWIMRNLCVGNVMDLSDNVVHEFKLVINCNENASFPSLHLLNSIYNDLNDCTTRNNVYYLEFPSSGSPVYESMTDSEILSLLNTLKLVQHLIRLDYKMFVFSFDGFTGLSLLLIAIHQLLHFTNFREAITDLIKRTKLYFFKQDLHLLNCLEGAINDLKTETSNGVFLKEVSLRGSKFCSDWFDLEKDNNFPSYVLPNVYLGSLNHANSTTVLSSISATKLISIGECPQWVQEQKDFAFWDVEGMEGELIPPVYSAGDCRIYEVDLNKYKCAPANLKHLVFIHNLKDDGRDSIIPLLIGCPEEVQRKFLPEFGKLTTMIHCRIGVSRSASLLMASIMRSYSVDLLSAYMFLRVQRFNIIIQPNLRIFYELFVYQDHLGLRGRNGLNWETLCMQIHRLNENYI